MSGYNIHNIQDYWTSEYLNVSVETHDRVHLYHMGRLFRMAERQANRFAFIIELHGHIDPYMIEACRR